MTGKGACILPHGVLFRGNAEADIRRALVRKGYIKGIIGLPANLFYGTGIPACIIVVDKEDAHTRQGIFMIDASNGYMKDGPKNRLRAQDIHKIVDIFTRQLDIAQYSRLVSFAEIEKNEFNLNLPRYIDSQEPEDIQDLANLSRDLTLLHGRGFSRSNLVYMRLLYLRYPISQKLSDLLSWSHYVELLKIDDDLERSFYEKQAILERWSVPELKRQKDSALFLRLAAGKDKAAILKLATQGQLVEQPSDILRDPYVFEFLKIPEPYLIPETHLETLLYDHLQQFLLELGKGFTFVGRQYRITVNNTHYRVDLVFYHRILRCFVLIDLKISDVQHQDIGQMNLYLGYFTNEENIEDDKPPIGIILTRHRDELLVEYATYEMNSQLFVQKYQLYLPDREELRRQLEMTLKQAGEEKKANMPGDSVTEAQP